MKKIFIILFCSSWFLLEAQNYQNICSPGITLFKNISGNIKAFRQDSAILQGNNDTLFISYRTIRPFQINGCFDTTNGSILGRRIKKKQDGTFYFFNSYHDTLTLKTQAPINESWKFCDLPGGRIDATVVNQLLDTVLGTPDSIKIITFQAKDLNGNNIPHFLNQKSMSLSRHYGIFATYDLYYMPDIETNDATVYYLAGKTIPVLGIQNLTCKDVYNFDVGDEFQWSGGWWNGAGPQWNTMKRVLGKEVFGDMDSVRYTIEYCKITWLPMPPPNVEYTHDTIIESYNFLTIGNNATIQNLPQTFQGGVNTHSPEFVRNMGIPGRQTQEYTTWRYTRSGYCWENPFEPTYNIYNYSQGLGVTYTYHEEFQNWPVIMSESMVYFMKGNEFWGTPLATNCNELLPVTESTGMLISNLKINPNPVENVAVLSYEGFSQGGLHYVLYDEFGQQIRIQNMNSNPFIFDRSGLQNGLYVISLFDDKNSILLRKKIIVK